MTDDVTNGCMVVMPWELLPVPPAGDRAFFFGWRTKPRFLVDERLGQGTVQFLADLKWNAKGVWDLGLEDEVVAALARKDKRILLSHHCNLLDDRRFPSTPNRASLCIPKLVAARRPSSKASSPSLAFSLRCHRCAKTPKYRSTRPGFQLEIT